MPMFQFTSVIPIPHFQAQGLQGSGSEVPSLNPGKSSNFLSPIRNNIRNNVQRF